MIAAVGLLALAAGLSGGGAVAVLVGCAVAGVGYGAAQSLTLVSAFARTGPQARATASAVWNVAFDAGTAIGAVLIGALTATSLGIWGAFAVLAALALASVPLASHVRPPVTWRVAPTFDRPRTAPHRCGRPADVEAWRIAADRPQQLAEVGDSSRGPVLTTTNARARGRG